MNPAWAFVELFLLTLVGILLGCRVFSYDISLGRRAGAAALFALLYNLPINLVFPLGFMAPLLTHLLPPIALYITLIDAEQKRQDVKGVFMIAYLSAALGVLMMHQLRT